MLIDNPEQSREIMAACEACPTHAGAESLVTGLCGAVDAYSAGVSRVYEPCGTNHRLKRSVVSPKRRWLWLNSRGCSAVHGRRRTLDAGLPESSDRASGLYGRDGAGAAGHPPRHHHPSHVDHVGGLNEMLELSGAEVWRTETTPR